METAVKKYVAALERADGLIENVKFCVGDRPNIEPEDIAKEAFHAVSMHQNGLTKASISFSEPDLDAVDLRVLLGQ